MIEDGLWSKTVGIIGLVVDVGTKRGWVERGVDEGTGWCRGPLTEGPRWTDSILVFALQVDLGFWHGSSKHDRKHCIKVWRSTCSGESWWSKWSEVYRRRSKKRCDLGSTESISATRCKSTLLFGTEVAKMVENIVLKFEVRLASGRDVSSDRGMV